MLQLDLVRHRAGAWASLGNYSSEFYDFLNFKNFVIIWIIRLIFCILSF